MTEIKNEILTGERALYGSESLKITDCIFENGESPLKECKDIMIDGSMFKWKYPLWYCRNISVKKAHGLKWQGQACGTLTVSMPRTA